MNYLSRNTAPNTQLVIADDIVQWHTSGQTVANGGTYLITASTAGQVAIADTALPIIDATNGITLAVGTPFYVYIRAGQTIKFSATTGTYVRLSPK